MSKAILQEEPSEIMPVTSSNLPKLDEDKTLLAANKAIARRERFCAELDLKRRCPVIMGERAPQPVEQVRIENAVGFAQVPIGLAGPLTISGKHQTGTFFAPLATTEPTLVASCARGCKAFQAMGGIKAAAIREGMLRAPVFRFSTVDDAVAFTAVLPHYENFFKREAAKTTRYGKLQTVKGHLIHKEVHVRFSYTCGDAGGQNMTTIATHAACSAFLNTYASKHKIIDFILEGQMGGDKKLTLMNTTDPRGVTVVAWGTISDDTARRVLGSSTKRIYETLTTTRAGAMRAGMVGDTINASNIVAAMFIACGQDAGSVFEGGWTQLGYTVDEDTQDLTFSLYMSNLPVASIGGGTSYSTQHECLQMLNCSGEGRKWALAETIAAFALALDISTISAISDDSFARSHQKLARL